MITVGTAIWPEIASVKLTARLTWPLDEFVAI